MSSYIRDFLWGALFIVIVFVATSLLSSGGHTIGSFIFESIYPAGIMGLLVFPIFELIIPLVLFLILIKTVWKNPLKKDYIRLVSFFLGGYMVYALGLVGFFLLGSSNFGF